MRLTEWKVVRAPSELQPQLRATYNQARRYGSGAPAGVDVAMTRYLVVISEDHMTMPVPRVEPDAIYEYRNIALKPKTPSRS